MTEYIHNVSLKTQDDIVSDAMQLGYDIEIIEGVLNDSTIIYADKQFTIGNRKGYDYIICGYSYASSNHNDLWIMLTDDVQELTKYIHND